MATQTVAVLAVDGTLNFELAVPGQVFGSANLASGSPLYDVRICRADARGPIATAREFGGPTISASTSFAQTTAIRSRA